MTKIYIDIENKELNTYIEVEFYGGVQIVDNGCMPDHHVWDIECEEVFFEDDNYTPDFKIVLDAYIEANLDSLKLQIEENYEEDYE